ncbi:condensation domain-containing protein [Kitasatospora sp. NPDC056446]|uniref:condensation domain-containing protein n=1 Tax=Kitasatospora sp. NPDC056446 TaxID=3345819 RepID=UPI0036B10C70
MAHSEVRNDVRDIRMPVTAAQLGVWVAQRMEPESPLYQCGVHFEAEGLDPGLLRRAVALAVAETEALRAGFGDEGEVYQVVRAEVDAGLTVVDLRAEAEPSEAARRGWRRTVKCARAALGWRKGKRPPGSHSGEGRQETAGERTHPVLDRRHRPRRERTGSGEAD